MKNQRRPPLAAGQYFLRLRPALGFASRKRSGFDDPRDAPMRRPAGGDFHVLAARRAERNPPDHVVTRLEVLATDADEMNRHGNRIPEEAESPERERLHYGMRDGHMRGELGVTECGMRNERAASPLLDAPAPHSVAAVIYFRARIAICENL